jgi:hypothetical protein
MDTKQRYSVDIQEDCRRIYAYCDCGKRLLTVQEGDSVVNLAQISSTTGGFRGRCKDCGIRHDFYVAPFLDDLTHAGLPSATTAEAEVYDAAVTNLIYDFFGTVWSVFGSLPPRTVATKYLGEDMERMGKGQIPSDEARGIKHRRSNRWKLRG